MRHALFLALALTSSVSFAQGPQPLKLWHSYRGAEEKALENAVRAFEETTGHKVELLAVPYDAFGSKLEATISHGTGPDVFIFAHERLRSFEQQHLVASSESSIQKSAYLPTALQALEVNGKTYGYPLALKCLALYVNTKLVPQPPENTDALLRELARLSKPAENRFGLAYESGDPYFHAGFLFGFGGELFDDQGKARFDTPGLTASLAFVKKMQDARYIPDEATGAKVKSLFNDGRAAMVISGPWFAGEISPSLSYTVAPLPTVSETGKPMQPYLGVEAAFVSAGSQQLEAANALARSLSLGLAAVNRASVGRQVPANVDAYENPLVHDDVLLTAFRDAAERARPMPNTLEMSKTWEPLKLTLRAVLQGETSPEDAGALATRRYKALNRVKPPERSAWPYVLVAVIALAGFIYWRTRGPRPQGTLARRYPELSRALFYVSPAAVGVAVLVMIPLVIGLSLSFFHHEAGEYTFVGLANFTDILASHGYRITEPLSFYFTLAVTLFWTVLNVVLHVSLGLGLAILLKNPLLRLRGVFRVLLIIPWAVPNYITALIWKGMFDRQFGAINGVLVALGMQPVSWFSKWTTAFAANVATNTWLGFPFMMVVALGALQSIPQDLYEAAEVDGASKWAQFRRITMPLLRPALLPSIILGSVWTFNMFNIIYLVSGGEPGGGTDILVSESYRWAFQRNQQYGFAAAYSVLIFFVLLGYSAFTKRLTRAAQEAVS